MFDDGLGYDEFAQLFSLTKKYSMNPYSNEDNCLKSSKVDIKRVVIFLNISVLNAKQKLLVSYIIIINDKWKYGHQND